MIIIDIPGLCLPHGLVGPKKLIAAVKQIAGRRFGLAALTPLVALFGGLTLGTAQTLPTGGQVTAGAGTISQAGVTTTINQATPRLAIDWNTFSSAANEAIVFNQPNAQAIALNRITGSSPSTLLGRLTANGQVFILNPNGVLFGAGAQVNVGGLVASTHSLGNADFMAGNHGFTLTPGALGTVVNQGTLTAAPGGYIALLAPEVRNEGVVTATLGTALMAAGDKITLNLDNGSLVGYSVDRGSLRALASNQHLIQADGGQVVLTARAAEALTTATVNNTGVIEARTLQNRAGRIVLLGDMAVGLTQVAGTLDASASAGGDGGFIETSAAQVKIADAARVTTTAPAGRTGTWLIDPTDYTIAATGGNITGAALGASLAGTNVTILSSGGGTAGNGDIHVNDAVSWSANTLTLTAARDININAVMTASGTSSLVMNTATTNGADGGVAGGTVNVALGAGGFTGRVDFGARSGPGFLTINGNGYTVINSLGAAGSVTGTDLQGMNGALAGYYALGANIDASATSAWNAGAGFLPVNNFTGSLNGLGHTVSSLTINRPSVPDIGLFGRSSGTLSNFGLVGGSVTGSYNVGSLAGQTQSGGSIRNVYSTVNVTATDGEAGGLVGINRQAITGSYATGSVSAVNQDAGGLVAWNQAGTISDSYATGNVSITSNYAGGLVAYAEAGTIINNSYATGNVSAGASLAGGLVGQIVSGSTISNSHATGNVTSLDASGGLVGYNEGSITNAYATGNVHATVFSGGLVGRNLTSGSVTNAYASGYVTGTTHLGGLVGQLSGTLSNVYATGSVTGTTNVGGLIGRADGSATIGKSYATGPVTGTTSVGGLIGLYNAGTISDSYWNRETTGQATSGGLANSFGKTTAEFRQASTFTGWDLAATGGSSAVWRIYEGNTAPLLRSLLTTLNLTLNYDGSGTPLTNIGGYSVPGGADSSKIFGTPDYTGALTLTNTGAAGSYLASAPVSGLYSSQQGYDLSATATRTITTTGSAAGTVRLDNPITWTNGTLILNATGSIDLNNRALTGDRLQLTAGTTIANTAAVDVNRFTLTAGTWSQVNATLPVFSADDFRLTGGTFLRVLGGDGTGGSPYQLADIYGLQGVGSGGMLGYSYVLANDIAASSTSGWNAGAGFAPITGGFSGTLNGLGHTVSGLTINRPAEDDVGLFRRSSGAISNLGLVGGSITGNNRVGAFVGRTTGGSLSHVYATGTVAALQWHVGGLVGYNDGGSISDSYATGNVTAQEKFAGGLVGYHENGGTISDSYATGDVTAVSGYAGGLAGWQRGATSSITRSYATGAVSVTANVDNLTAAGGLAGANEGGTISDSHATGAVSSNNGRAGGLVGLNYNSGSITRSYATGNVTATGNNVGGLAGHNYNSGTITNSYATGNVTSSGNNVGGLVGQNQLSGSILNAYATGSVTGANGVGGLAGRLNTGTITNTYATGSVNGTTNAGGLIGEITTGTITASYWNKETTGRTTSAGLVDSFGKTTAELRQASTFAGWDLATTGGSSAVWRIYEGNTAPLLRSFLTSLTLANTTLTYSGATQSGATIASSGLRSGTAASGRNVGSYTAFSHQQGYDLTGGSLTVTPANLVLTTGNVTKTYDGGLSALGTAVATSGTQLFGADTATGGTFAFTDKNAGSGNKTVTVSGLTVNDGNSGANYTVSYASNTTSTITPKAVTIAGITASNKVYDGTTAATVNGAGASYTGLIGGDVATLNLGNIAGSFADKNAGTAKAINVTGLGLTGADAANYSVSATTTATADITPRSLTATATGVNKTYDGTTAATVTFGDNRIAGDTLTLSGAALFADKNAGAGKAVSVTGISGTGADLANYTLGNTTATTTANITPKALVIDGLTASNKVYDGTTATTVNGAGASYTGLIGGDVVTLNLGNITGRFADKNVGTAKAISVTGLGLTGADAANYSANATTTATADITPRSLTATATGVNKIYDGTTAATVTFGDNRIAGDTLTLSGAALFADKNAGAGKAVSVTGISGTGADLANYTLGNTTATTTANITPKELSVGGLSASNKVYDGTTAATVNTAGASYSGLIAGDVVTLNLGNITGRFTDKNVGTAKAISVTGLGLTGADAANYSANATTTATADITAAALTVTANNDHRPAHGTAYRGGNGVTYTGFVAGETDSVLTGSLTYGGSSQGASAMGDYIITPGGLSAANYSLSFADGQLSLSRTSPVADERYASARRYLARAGHLFTADAAGNVAVIPSGLNVTSYLRWFNDDELSITSTRPATPEPGESQTNPRWYLTRVRHSFSDDSRVVEATILAGTAEATDNE